MAIPRTEYQNRTQGYIGAIKIARNGEEKSIAIEPLARVFLTADEVEATEASHRSRADSPFELHEIIHLDMATGDETARFTAPMLEKVEKKSREPAAS